MYLGAARGSIAAPVPLVVWLAQHPVTVGPNIPFRCSRRINMAFPDTAEIERVVNEVLVEAENCARVHVDRHGKGVKFYFIEGCPACIADAVSGLEQFLSEKTDAEITIRQELIQ